MKLFGYELLYRIVRHTGAIETPLLVVQATTSLKFAVDCLKQDNDYSLLISVRKCI